MEIIQSVKKKSGNSGDKEDCDWWRERQGRGRKKKKKNHTQYAKA
jgi:hypothetical protein